MLWLQILYYWHCNHFLKFQNKWIFLDIVAQWRRLCTVIKICLCVISIHNPTGWLACGSILPLREYGLIWD